MLALALLPLATVSLAFPGNEDGLPGAFELSGALSYGSNVHAPDGCDFAAGACAPLTDLWGHVGAGGEELALVGVVNGVSVVRLPADGPPEEVAWLGGCLTEWRDLKVWGDKLYVVNDATVLCSCVEQPCQLNMRVDAAAGSLSMPVHEGQFTPALAATGNVTGAVAAVEPALACENITNTADVAGKVALIDRGICSFASKVRRAQDAGAIAVLIANDRYDIVPPSMTGEPDESLTIPALTITKQDGETLREQLALGSDTLRVHLEPDFYTDNDAYLPPDGLVIIDLADPAAPQVVRKTTEWFYFAHNIYIEETRPYLYVSGMRCGGVECEDGQFKDGVLVFDLTDPLNPELLASWEDFYLHDVVVQENDGQFLLYGSGIYDRKVFIFDVTNPANLGRSVLTFDTPLWAHNAWPTEDHDILYVTHEDDAMPITIWDLSAMPLVEYVGNISINIHNRTIPHNVILQGDLLWASYYSEGIAVFSVADPRSPVLFAHFDSSDYTSGFHGVWGIYPTPDNTRAYASDIENGLFVFDYTGPATESASQSQSQSPTPTPTATQSPRPQLPQSESHTARIDYSTQSPGPTYGPVVGPSPAPESSFMDFAIPVVLFAAFAAVVVLWRYKRAQQPRRYNEFDGHQMHFVGEDDGFDD